MAEGGGEEDLDNPFSFKSYVKKKTKSQDEHDVNTDDIFAVTGSASSRKKEKLSLVVADDDDSVSQSAQPTRSKKKGNENPFSFKKFLGQSGQKDSTSRPQQRNNPSPDASRNGPSLGAVCSQSQPRNFPLAAAKQPCSDQSAAVPPDFASDLPDFIQNHYGDDASRFIDDRRHLPDFALPTGGFLSNSAGRDGGHDPVSLFEQEPEENQADSTFSDDESGAQRSRQLSLPDFLVDSAVTGAQGYTGEDGRDSVSGRGQDSPPRVQFPELPSIADRTRVRNGNDATASNSAAVHQLQEENRQLRATVKQLQQKAGDEEARIAEFEKEISRLRKKEAEETAVMERAVQQVEENLVTTTTRAVQAESLVSKLKQETKSLQAQVMALSAENQALKSGDRGLADIRERTKYTSEQLAASAVTAEKNLKELLEGVEKLKLLGQVLGSLEKITEVDSPTQEHSSKTSPS